MEQIFLGNQELFKGLWIYDKIDWQPRPVIRLSMKEIDYKNQDLETVLACYEVFNKPIIDFIEDFRKAEANRDTLRNFYGALKDGVVDAHIHFLFITGISKFAKTSIFSELNNPTDLTMDPLALDLCGITQEELERDFDSYISIVAANLGLQTLIFIEDALIENDMEAFIQQLKILFSDIAYQLHPKINKKEPTTEDEAKLSTSWNSNWMLLPKKQ